MANNVMLKETKLNFIHISVLLGYAKFLVYIRKFLVQVGAKIWKSLKTLRLLLFGRYSSLRFLLYQFGCLVLKSSACVTDSFGRIVHQAYCSSIFFEVVHWVPAPSFKTEH